MGSLSAPSSDGADPAQRTELRGPAGRIVSALRIERLATGLIGPISFDIAAGECLALMGPSGAGKSLLLRAIADLDPNTGYVTAGARARHERPASEWRKLVAPVRAESGWWADRVRDHFPANYDATGQIEKLELAGSLKWEVGRLSTARLWRPVGIEPTTSYEVSNGIIRLFLMGQRGMLACLLAEFDGCR